MASAIQRLTSPSPNLNDVTINLFRYIANHPLIIKPMIYHPLTSENIVIDKYRLYDGYSLDNGLVCSIYANYPQRATEFETYDLGSNGSDMATFFIRVKFSYNEIVLGNVETNKNIIEVPAWVDYGIGQNLLTSSSKKSVNLEINPGIQIIQEYLQLLKYVIDEAQTNKDFPLPIHSIVMESQWVKTNRWDEEDTIYFQEGQALINISAYISRGWKDKLIPLYKTNSKININNLK